MLERVKERLQALGYVTKESDDTALLMSIEKAEYKIKNICKLSSVPEGLRNVLIDRSCGEFLFIVKQTGKWEEINLETAVKHIKSGDTDITYAIGEGSMTDEQRIDSLISYLLNSGTGEFTCYRTFKW